MPNEISFKIDQIKDDIWSITPCIDGAPLTILITQFELSKGFADPAGGYGGLVPSFNRFGRLDRHFCGEARKRGMSDKDGEIWVLACECGEVGCWPLMTSVTRMAGGYQWSDFRQPHRPERNYDGFGPFVFDKAQYEYAVRDVTLKLEKPGRAN
jgi:hypothetical protein